MITRALVIKQVDKKEYAWYVNIPILNGIPDSNAEAALYNAALESAIQLNDKASENNKKSKYSIAKTVTETWGKSTPSISNYKDGVSTTLAKLANADWEISGQASEYIMEASVCGSPDIANSILPGDVVYVGFENNDMGKPIILGHLLTKEILLKRSEFAKSTAITIPQLSVTNSIKLPSNITLILPNPKESNKPLELNGDDLALLWLFYKNQQNNLPGTN